ncbi:hypothetical protein ONZ51_g9637 [Trametes cubensis]|uniref:Protein kinase domain-containing protein n=1 Tax=Trametes cubensis TaxID=1111947 RepID=A0AAD7X9L7_9APHY|nr:hypothetical protein ONZ51_g9637 [Trametes cubensis]
MAHFGCARDRLHQDNIIKLIDKGTMEEQIYQYLADCEALYDGDAFPCVLPPTAVIASPYKFTFIATPIYDIEEFSTIRGVFTFLRCTLTGLEFLHRHRIAHRDIHETNVMINWYCRDGKLDSCSQRLREHYSSSSASYALFDYDLALQLPSTASLKDCRRPALEAFLGKSEYHPRDIHQGEGHYNPFAFDVACLGNLFLYHFVEAIPTVPLLAVLFSRMTTHVIDDRFTAAEALAFFSDIEAQVPSGVLDSSITLKLDYGPLDDPDLYWLRLSPDDRIKWRSHRTPKLSWSTRVLRWLNTTRIGWKIIPFVRRSLGNTAAIAPSWNPNTGLEALFAFQGLEQPVESDRNNTVKEMRAWAVFLTFMVPFWTGYQRHFQAVGITLCPTRDSYWLLPESTTPAPSPYALRCRREGQNHPLSLYESPKFACLRDLFGQDIIIKLVDKGTMEDQIYRYLASCPALYDATTFPHAEGLSFLHDHRIAHRDIHESNIMINWYCGNGGDEDDCAERRRAHYRSPSALYALLDFDFSLQLPLKTSLRDCRRPACEAFDGKDDYHPYDVFQGERHYNPFAFDVACLGNLFLYHFAKDAIPVVPPLAVLFSKMTTHVIGDRFTATETLTFFNGIETALPSGILDSGITLKPEYGPLDDARLYWSRLPPNDQLKWQSHRPPPPPWWVRVLRRLNATRIGWTVVPFLRRSLRI